MLGHHAYKEIFEPKTGQVLPLMREPENATDKNAVATTEEGRIVGHIPLGLSKFVSRFLRREGHEGVAIICGKRINRGGGLGLEIPVEYKFFGGPSYLDRLDKFIQESEAAKNSLREEGEGTVEETKTGKKRKSRSSVKQAKGSKSSRKYSA